MVKLRRGDGRGRGGGRGGVEGKGGGGGEVGEVDLWGGGGGGGGGGGEGRGEQSCPRAAVARRRCEGEDCGVVRGAARGGCRDPGAAGISGQEERDQLTQEERDQLTQLPVSRILLGRTSWYSRRDKLSQEEGQDNSGEGTSWLSFGTGPMVRGGVLGDSLFSINE